MMCVWRGNKEGERGKAGEGAKEGSIELRRALGAAMGNGQGGGCRRRRGGGR